MNAQYPDAAQVWQRVHPLTPGEVPTLQTLYLELRQDLAFLQSLKRAPALVKHYTEQQNCLKGLMILSGDRLPKNTPAPFQDHSLSRCYDHALRRLSAFQLRSADPIYGPVFRELAQETQHNCRQIAQLLGSS